MKARKFVALLTLVSLSFSYCSPALADSQEEKLREREKFLTERALDLSGQSVDLDDKAQALNRRAAELEELSKSIQSKNVEATVREIELEDLQASLNKDSARLVAENQELDRNKVEFEAYKAEVDTRYKESLKIAQDAIKKFKEAEDKEQLNEAERLELNDLRAKAESALQEAKTMRAEALEKKQRADEVIKVNEEQRAEIAMLKDEIEKKNKQIVELQNPVPAHTEWTASTVPIPPHSSLTVTEHGIMNWTDGSIRARGFGVAPDKAANEAQGQALARRAAILDLQRNLLETIQGVQIDAETKMVNFMAEDRVNSAVQGTIKGVEIIEEKWDEASKTYTVAGQVKQEKLGGAMSLIRRHMKQAKKPSERGPKTGNYTGLILDVRHLQVEHQKFFHVVDEKGQLVYGTEYADNKKQDTNGLCVYFNKLVTASEEQNKVGNNPLVIKAQRFASNGTDIVIPTSEADKIRSNKIDFRKDCKVIVVVEG